MKKLNICISTYSFSPGGVSKFIMTLAERLLTDGHHVEILCTDTKGEWFELLEKKNHKPKFIKFGIWGWIPFGRMFHSFRVGFYLRNLNYDLIINNHSFFVHSSSKFFRPQTKLISVIHNQLPFMVNQECRSQSDAIVCVSKKIDEIASQFTNSENLFTIINGADFPFAKEVESIERDLTQLKLIFVGRIENRQKGVFLLPEIISKLIEKKYQIELRIVGIGPDSDVLKKMITNMNLNKFIHFEGLVKPEYIAKYYQTHHIMLLPSYFEGLPLTLIEAMGNGCVPIASLLPDSTDICIENGKNGFLISVGDTSGFISKIELLFNDRNLLKKMSSSAVSKANDNFSVDKMYAQYLLVINKIMEAPSAYSSQNKQVSYFTWREAVPFNLIILIKNKFGLFKK